MNYNLNEMAQISGELKGAIERVIEENPEENGLVLKKIIRKDSGVQSALDGDQLYDNQLNKFIALQKGERTLSQRGRKPGEVTSQLSIIKSILSKSSEGISDFSDDEIKMVDKLHSLVNGGESVEENDYSINRLQELAGIESKKKLWK